MMTEVVMMMMMINTVVLCLHEHMRDRRDEERDQKVTTTHVSDQIQQS